MREAIEQLEIARKTYRTNAPIYREEGNLTQALHAEKAMEEIQKALHVLESQDSPELLSASILPPSFASLRSWLVETGLITNAVFHTVKGTKYIRIKMFLDEIVVSVKASPASCDTDKGYLGGEATLRKCLPGEDWLRGFDLRDGPYTKEAFFKIIFDAFSTLTIPVGPKKVDSLSLGHREAAVAE